ncbi:hypothetical protein FOMPIDRAFT_95110, partial [Fomitopsis schrenkii]
STTSNGLPNFTRRPAASSARAASSATPTSGPGDRDVDMHDAREFDPDDIIDYDEEERNGRKQQKKKTRSTKDKQ